jgi:hypothetical protein
MIAHANARQPIAININEIQILTANDHEIKKGNAN